MADFKLSDKGLQLILNGEVGGGRKYYDKYCRFPVVPDPHNTMSGITIGIGWDCGQNSPDAFEMEWTAYLKEENSRALKATCGLKRFAAAKALESVKHIEIPFDTAVVQFQVHTVQRYWRLTQSAFPGIEIAPQCVKEALLSLVFNRGTSMSGDRRREMREIQEFVSCGSWNEIPDRIRSMKRLWPSVKGLLRRREEEAAHIELGLQEEKME